MGKRDYKVVYHFENLGATGVNELPTQALIFVESENSFFVKENSSNMDSNTTLQAALSSGSIQPARMTRTTGTNFGPDEIVLHDEYATATNSGVVKLAVDNSDPTRPILYIRTDGQNIVF